MSDIGIFIYYIIIGLSHVAFGLFSTSHRFNKVVTTICYACFLALFLGIGCIKMRFALFFIIAFFIYLAFYMLLSDGKLMKNLVLIISYLTYVIIFFGITFAATFIEGPGKFWIRWLIIIPTLGILQFFMYWYLLPQFKKAERLINKGWSTLLVGDILFLIMIFMQIFYPFKLDKDNLWTVVIFLLSSFIYLYLFTVVFHSYANQVSYYKEREKNDHLQVVANHDALTDLYNRNYFEYFADKLEVKYKDEPIKDSAVIVMDINKFKSINDTYGHAKGDELLKDVATEIKNVFSEDVYTCFRIGGDEFVVVALHIDKITLKEKISELHRSLINKENISISIGYNFVDYKNYDAIATAFKNADKFMYQEKLR